MNSRTVDLLETAMNKRQLLRRHTNAVRLVNGSGDGLKGLVLEQYDRHFVAHVFDAQWIAQKDALTNFLKHRCAARYFIMKDRTESGTFSADDLKITVEIAEVSSQTIVQENRLKFAVDLNDTLNSGLFLDMRRNRKLVAGLAKGCKVLNGFAYTCSFGVYCRAAGALSVVNVDISRKSLARGRVNYQLNQLMPAPDEFVSADVVRYLKRALKKDNRFDVIILDPPSFARYEGKTFSVKKNLAELIDLAIKVLNPNGNLFISTNLSEMSHDQLTNMIFSAVPKQRIKNIRRLGQDEDFPGSGRMPESYLAAVLVKL
jgi:23S rRNA (cytosine1962-C5)-methyltransferase